MPGNFLLGYEGVLYLTTEPLDGRPGDAGVTVDYSTATYNEMDNVTDVDGNFDSDKVDTTTRSEAKLGWASEISTTKKGETSFTMRWKPGDARFDQLRNAWLFSQTVGVLDMDQALTVNGAQGLVGNMSVSFGVKRPVKGIQVVDVKLTVAEYPNWVESDGTGDGSGLTAVTES